MTISCAWWAAKCVYKICRNIYERKALRNEKKFACLASRAKRKSVSNGNVTYGKFNSNEHEWRSEFYLRGVVFNVPGEKNARRIKIFMFGSRNGASDWGRAK